jgi:L-alanine-DL-glutamate epimerase-like enolase superfamily enzyme
VNTPYKIDNGHASVTEAPGWGVEINPAWLEASHYQKSALADMPGLAVNR